MNKKGKNILFQMYKTLKYIQRKSLLNLFISASILILINTVSLSQNKDNAVKRYSGPDVVIQQVLFDPNNISTWIYNMGIFDQDLRVSNTPGFEWPKGSGKFAIFTAGLCTACYINYNGTPQLREAMCSYKGEYAPGYISNAGSVPVAMTDSRFKIYKIKRGDNATNNPDWLNWQLMVPFGAPFIDVNHNGVFEPFIDTPGVKGAKQTLFACLTDGFIEEHKLGEGFGGGTAPIFAEMHWTSWAYDNPGLEDMQFMRFEVINKSMRSWDSTHMAIVADPDLGFPDDDYIGCDTIRKLGYCYNSSDTDGTGGGVSYGLHPPAVGFVWLNCGQGHNIGMRSFTYFSNPTTSGDSCEIGNPYFMLKGLKGDGTPWVIPNISPPQITKYCYSGDPESGTGWTEYTGKIQNCGGSLTGPLIAPVPPGDRRIIFGSGAPDYNINYQDTVKIIIAQLIARGTNNKNSVTKLKQLTDVARELCNNGFVIGIEKISSNVSREFALYQNYPNPFNPSTKIKFDIPSNVKRETSSVRLIVYDVLGKEVVSLVNENLKPGTYEVEWDGTNFPSGVYFYKITAGVYLLTKKMILLK
jgi:hypothetical protein